jgi:large subunit ribosomal protein L25
MVNLDAVLELEDRKVIRKKLHGLRAEGKVPAVIHNHGAESLHVMGDAKALTAIYHEAGKHHPLNLKVGSQDFLALIKDVSQHPVKHQIEHIVFQAIRRDVKVEAVVPIHLEGEIPAEKTGLMVLHQLDEVEVLALPANLPDELKVDATGLAEIGDKITIADLQVPEGVEVNEEQDRPIATIVETKAQISEEDEAAEGEEGEEGVEGEEGAEGESGEAGAEGGGDKGDAKEGGEKEIAGKESKE